MTSSATADSGLCVSLPTDHQHNPYFMNLVNSSDDDQDGLWFILPLLCWFCKAKTTVEQEQLFQSLKSAKSKLSEEGGSLDIFSKDNIPLTKTNSFKLWNT